MHKIKVAWGLALFSSLMAVTALGQKKPAQGGPNQQNEAIARSVFDDLWSHGRYEKINQIYAPNCIVHYGNRTESLQQAVTEGKGWRLASPDLAMTAQQVSSRGNIVTIAWMVRGTHTGHGHGLKPTGKQFQLRGTSHFRFANGKIVEVTSTEFQDDLFRQLGVSKTTAAMFETGVTLWAAVSDLFPNPLYALLQ